MHPLTQRGSSPNVQQAHWLSLPPVIVSLHPCSPSSLGPRCTCDHLLVQVSRHTWWVALGPELWWGHCLSLLCPAHRQRRENPSGSYAPWRSWTVRPTAGTHPRGAGSRQAVVASHIPCQRGGVTVGLLLLGPHLLPPPSRWQWLLRCHSVTLTPIPLPLSQC